MPSANKQRESGRAPRVGFSLVELLVVIAVIMLLSSICLPSLGQARDRARTIACAAGLHDIHQSLMAYAAANNCRLPPFRFSSPGGASLPESGHWGGVSDADDPGLFGTRMEMDGRLLSVNLWTLVEFGSLPPARLVCPGAGRELSDHEASMFAYSGKFSTYCLRFPYSEDLFRRSPVWRKCYGMDLLDAYRGQYGGYLGLPGEQDHPTEGTRRQRVPLVRTDRRYRVSPEIAGDIGWGDGEYDVAADVMLSDAFWWRDRSTEAPKNGELRTYPVRARWCHGDSFNAATGDGAVWTVKDDRQGRIAANCISDDSAPTDAGPCDAVAAERVWQFLDARGKVN